MAQHRPTPWTLTARWVFPVSGPPLERGIVTIDRERIVAVEPHGARAADLDLGNAAVLPGLVNAHTHLDLTGLRGQCPPTPDFTGWLRAVIRYRRTIPPEQIETHVRQGLRESMAHGTTLLGDIAGQGLSWPVLAAAAVRSVVFYEVLGLPMVRARQAWADVEAWLGSHPSVANCRPGVSPHAPYSVRASLFLAASTAGVAAAVHLAETAAEQDLLGHRRGPFVAFLRELGVWDPTGLAEDAEHVLRLFNGLSPALFIHGNYLPTEAPIPPNGSLVYCPRTHAAFGHSPHPFRAFLARGVRVALGTDSLASNPDLDILAEARFLHAHSPDLAGAALLRMATLSGAEALGWGEETGSLEAGKSADLIVLPLPSADHSDPHRLIWESSSPVRAVLWRGQWLSGDLALPRRRREGSS